MRTATVNKLIFENDSPNPFDGYDATEYSLRAEQEILDHWEYACKKQICLAILTLGLTLCCQKKLNSKEALLNRITEYRLFSLDMEAKARKLQLFAAKKIFRKHREISLKVRKYHGPQFDSHLKTAVQVLGTLMKEPNFWSGPRGGVIWKRTTKLYKALVRQGNHVFIHAHSYPITLHLEIASHLQSTHQSTKFKREKPLETRRKFRAPGVAKHFRNTKEYLKSQLAKDINSKKTMDDNHRESIISCDAILSNNEAYESAQHFFKSNKSIIDTFSSTGMKNITFDKSFLSSFILNDSLLEYGVLLFSKARKQLSEFSQYGMIRVISISSKTLEDEKTNYIWRSHAFGVLCRCKHSHSYGHQEFVETLRAHQNNQVKKCVHGSFPQYRILASNIDADPTKQVYIMDCLNSKERERYKTVLNNLKNSLNRIYRLEHLSESKTVTEMASVLMGINLHENLTIYKKGIHTILKKNSFLINAHLSELQQLLPADQFSYILKLI